MSARSFIDTNVLIYADDQLVPVADVDHGVELTAEVLAAHCCGEFGREIVFCRLRNKWVLDE